MSLSAIPTLFGVRGAVAVVTGGGTGKLNYIPKLFDRYCRNGNIIPVECDISSPKSLQSLANTVKARHGYLNLLVNNAGVALNLLPKLPTPKTGDIKSFQRALLNAGTPQDFATTFNVNTTAAYYCSVLFLDLLDAGNRRGNMRGVSSQVITIASGGGYRRDDKVFSVSYTLSKAAAIHLGKLLANFFKDWQIRSNVICPGVFPSCMSPPSTFMAA
ncbi:hypothetical protein PHLCEN_2v12120 [Hermanssonia centrifuga]|uniref:Uncharacterized protein n=1 Tax=Hermanssonia centrifuga TaxID=98765 RepID=A0A2R6NHZ8_9APHY|nr:hypothetical protein PHLCEN_2v12120 [Hermanssonia centrifuga]